MRFNFLLVLAVLLVAVLLFSIAPEQKAKAAIDDKPNIVFINTDDLSMDDYKTIGILRKETGDRGVYFKNAYVTTSLCCPSRATTLTGQYVHNHGVRRHVGPGTGYEAFNRGDHQNSTFATWLQGEGYETALVGKYLNGYKVEYEKPPGWSQWYAADTPADTWELRENDTIHSYPQERSNPSYRHWEDVMGDKAVKFINAADEDKPMMLYYATHAPHSPHIWPRRHEDRFKNTLLPKNASFNEKDISDKPRYIRSLGLKSESYLTRDNRDRLRSILSVVDQINRIEATLNARGELSNTMFMLTSDNGYHLGQHRLPPGKQTPYETDHRVPLAVWGKGITPGQTRDHYVLNTDFGMTMADIVGISSSSLPNYHNEIDGRSFKRLLNSNPPKLDYRRHFVVENYFGEDVLGAIVPPTQHVLYGIAQKFSFTQYTTGELEYYNLARDPFQINNNAKNLEARRRQLLDKLSGQIYTCAGDECRDKEGGR